MMLQLAEAPPSMILTHTHTHTNMQISTFMHMQTHASTHTDANTNISCRNTPGFDHYEILKRDTKHFRMNLQMGDILFIFTYLLSLVRLVRMTHRNH